MWTYHNPVAIHAGPGRLDRLPELLAGRDCLLVTFPEAESLGLVQQLRQRLGSQLRGVVDGKGSKQIASDLSISVKTVDVHRASIKEKLGATSIAALVRDVMVVWGDDGEASR